MRHKQQSTQKVFTKVQISYNSIGAYVKLCDTRLPDGTYARLFPRTFTERKGEGYDKSPVYVTQENARYRAVLECIQKHADTITSIDVFIGKKSSGGVAMISRLCEDLPDMRERIFWIVCHHDLHEKCTVLEQYGIATVGNPRVYKIEDGEHPCREEYVLLGRLLSVR